MPILLLMDIIFYLGENLSDPIWFTGTAGA